MHRFIALGLLCAAPACLNPDISDELPLTTEAEAIDVDDGGEASDEAADEDTVTDDEASDDEASDDDSSGRQLPATDVNERERPRRTWLRR
ncbi:MAG TPA: hypothetical protein VMG12_24915 [Polyangiaceae bacterium]|nr:hypothetical protein [Polyangiaceae bacterium]